MTEKEAKKKACCGTRKGKCIGTGCMGWRWDTIPNPHYQSQMAVYPASSNPSHIKSTTDGHCGLAGGAP